MYNKILSMVTEGCPVYISLRNNGICRPDFYMEITKQQMLELQQARDAHRRSLSLMANTPYGASYASFDKYIRDL